MRTGSLVALVALAALPAVAAQAAPYGVEVEGGPDVRAPSGAETTVWLRVSNQQDAAARVRVTTDLVEGEAGETPLGGLTIRSDAANEDIRLGPGEDARVALTLAPHGGPQTWRVRVVVQELEGAPPTSVATWFTVRTGPSPLGEAGQVAAAGLAGAAVGGVVAFALSRPPVRGALLLPFVALYSRLRPSDALSQERRARIHDLILERPGIGYAALMRETGLGAGVLVHHLRALERAGLVVSRRMGMRRWVYPAGAAGSPPDLTAAQERVLEELRRGALTQGELRERLGLSQQGVSYHVQNLARRGRVRAEAAPGETRWRATDEDGAGRA